MALGNLHARAYRQVRANGNSIGHKRRICEWRRERKKRGQINRRALCSRRHVEGDPLLPPGTVDQYRFTDKDFCGLSVRRPGGRSCDSGSIGLHVVAQDGPLVRIKQP